MYWLLTYNEFSSLFTRTEIRAGSYIQICKQCLNDHQSIVYLRELAEEEFQELIRGE
jgi:DNA repair protein RadC